MNWGSVADWAAVVAAIGAVTAAFLSARAALEMNARTKASNRVAAFSERFKVFEIVRDALELVVHNKQPEKSYASDKLRDAEHRARFLFPAGFADFIEQMRYDVIDATPSEDIEGGFSDETRQTRNQAMKKVFRHHKELSQTFSPHMRVGE